MAQDGFDKLEGADLKAPIEISFIDQFGQEEYVLALSPFRMCNIIPLLILGLPQSRYRWWRGFQGILHLALQRGIRYRSRIVAHQQEE